MLDHPAGAATRRAGLRADELAEGAPRDLLQPPEPLARRARRHLRAWLDPGRLTASARDRDAERNLPLGSRRRLHELDLDVGGDVRAPRARPHRRREQVVAEEGGEDVGEAAEVEGRRTEAAAA